LVVEVAVEEVLPEAHLVRAEAALLA